MSATFISLGDVLLHKEVYTSARRAPGQYDFSSLFEGVAPLVAAADIATINQETILVGDESQVSSFPAFGSPVAIADAIADAGFNVVTQASNHALDKGLPAIRGTIAHWERLSDRVTMLGLHGSAEDQRRTPIVEAAGIRFSLLNATIPLNLHRVPRSAPYCLDVMSRSTRRSFLARVERAKAEADFVVVLPHWGYEYLFEPSDKQRRWAGELARAGADLIVGTHPHVLQTVEWIERTGEPDTLCYYSLGNFVSCQVGSATMLGGLAEVEVERLDGRARIASHGIRGVVTHAEPDFARFSVHPLEEYTDELAARNRIFRAVERIHGIERVDRAYLERLFRDILEGRAQASNRFQSPWDVRKANAKGVWKALTGKSTEK